MLTQRAAVLAEQRMRKEGYGDAPCPYVLAVLGSAGRGESLLAMDQDNALICADGAEPAMPIGGLRRSARTWPTSCTRSACPTAREA